MIFLLPSSAAARILGYRAGWGVIDVKFDVAEDVALLVGASEAQRAKLPVRSPWLDEHYLNQASVHPGVGVWYRADAGLAEDGLVSAARHSALDTQTEFRPRVRGWTFPPYDGGWWVITLAQAAGREPEWAAWQVTRATARWHPVTIVYEQASLLQPLAESWPLQVLAPQHVTIVGAGSIGGAAAVALAGYGIRRLTIIDPQHLEPHNFARHVLHPRLAGRAKANALRDHLTGRDPDVAVTAERLDIVRDADVVRPLLLETDVVLCATDGVATRRVANHLSVWAKKPVVFACVLEDGAYGEVLRVRPHRTGCLQCDRDELLATGRLDPEPGLDRDYTMGWGARPMTAVGSDLTLVGQLAAKCVVATLLENDGSRAHALPGDVMTIALSPLPDLQEPFDLERTLEVRWRALPAPRAECPSCGAT